MARHAPRADLGVGLALLIGGLAFFPIALLGGWGTAWQVMGALAALTGAGKSYRAGRRIQEQRGRRRGGPKPPPPSSHRWSESLPWASEQWEDKKPKKKKKRKGGTRQELPCTPACFNSVAARGDCRCTCKGTRHGLGARNGNGRGTNGRKPNTNGRQRTRRKP